MDFYVSLFYMVSMPNEKLLECYIVILYNGDNSNIFLGDQWQTKVNVCLNVPISIGGVGDLPLTC